MFKIKIHPWPLGIILFFLVVVSVNSYLVYLSVRYPATATVSDAYSESLQYDNQMAAIENGRTSGARPAIKIEKNEAEVSLNVATFAAENALQPVFSTLHLELKNFADSSFDQAINLLPGGDGRFTVKNTGLNQLRPGKWEITLHGTDQSGVSYLWKKNMIVSESESEDSSSLHFP
ncbi:MAG: FixH family protein [bacterium]|nr:FixH family protein [bacterium]